MQALWHQTMIIYSTLTLPNLSLVSPYILHPSFDSLPRLQQVHTADFIGDLDCHVYHLLIAHLD